MSLNLQYTVVCFDIRVCLLTTHPITDDVDFFDVNNRFQRNDVNDILVVVIREYDNFVGINYSSRFPLTEIRRVRLASIRVH